MSGKKFGNTFLSALGAGKDAIVNTLKGAEAAGEKGKEALYVAVPVTALVAAYMASRLLSPGGVRENVSDIVINNNEHANLMQSIRELDRLEAYKALKSTAKVHDQFI